MFGINLNKIRNKLLLVLLLVTLLPTVLIGGYALIFTTDNLRESSVSVQSKKIELISEKINNYLGQVNSDLFYLRDSNALNLYISALESGSSSRQYTMLTNLRNSFKKFAKQKKIYQQIRFIGDTGKEALRIDYIDDKANNVTSLQNKKNTEYFSSTIKLNNGDLYISPLNLNREQGKVEKPIRPTIRYATPVIDSSNKKIGIIILNVDMKSVMQILASEMPEGTQLQFVNKEGFYYFHPDGSKTWGGEDDLNTGISLFSDRNDLQAAIKNATDTANITTSDEIIIYKPISINNGEKKLGTLLDVAPKDVVFKEASSFLYIFLGIILLALILTTILAILLSNSISHPLIALTDDVDRLSKGDLETPISVKSDDEIGKLSTAVERLRKSMRILMRRAG